MFADDLLIVTSATRRSANNILLCLNLYLGLTGQKSNLNKSAIYLPSWCNRRLANSIARILKIKLDSFPFLYLGVPISPKKLPLNHFSYLTNRVSSLIHSWNHSPITTIGRSILLNASIFSIPNYLMSVMNIPTTILDSISKLARNFLWGKTSNRSGFHTIGWRIATMDKSEGGLGIRNLKLAQHSLMAKNVFTVLNNDNKLWVNIFNYKYRNWTLWGTNSQRNTSWFFKSFCNSASLLKNNIRLLNCNLDATNMWTDPWLMDIPIMHKPTYLNMSIPLENTTLHDIVDSNGPILDRIYHMFGHNLDWNWINNLNMSATNTNLWVWTPHTHHATMASAVYNHINRDSNDYNIWEGWRNIWKICTLPKIKLFIWQTAHGKLTTNALLYHLNIGPHTLCTLCGLEEETAKHLLWGCSKTAPCWYNLFTFLGLDTANTHHLGTGQWLLHNDKSWAGTSRVKALIASVSWLIWKERCNKIFKNSDPKMENIVPRAWALCEDFFKASGHSYREVSKPLSHLNSIYIYTDASWNASDKEAGLGFIIILKPTTILLAGHTGNRVDSPFKAEIEAMCLALTNCLANNWIPNLLLCDCPGIAQIIKNYTPAIAWRVNETVQKLRLHLKNFPNLKIETIPREDNNIADSLAAKARANPQLTLYSQGRDRPRWLEELCASRSLTF